MSAISHKQLLLAAAHRLDREFTGPELVVAAWTLRPAAFGLRGYEAHYPDANRVYARLDGHGGLVHRELIESLGSRTYKLTGHGRELARIANELVRELS